MNSLTHITTPELADRLAIDLSPSAVAPIDIAKVEQLAARILGRQECGKLTRAKWSDPRCWNVEGTPTERSQYFAIGNSINFRYWESREGRVETAKGFKGGEEFRGAMYMWRCLRV